MMSGEIYLSETALSGKSQSFSGKTLLLKTELVSYLI